jgi:hypothetical protein
MGGRIYYTSMKMERDFNLIVDPEKRNNQNYPKVYGITDFVSLCRAEVTEKRMTQINQGNQHKDSFSGIDKSKFNILVPNYNEWKREWLDELKNKNNKQSQ